MRYRPFHWVLILGWLTFDVFFEGKTVGEAPTVVLYYYIYI
jgi:hypothetical protein